MLPNLSMGGGLVSSSSTYFFLLASSFFSTLFFTHGHVMHNILFVNKPLTLIFFHFKEL